MKAKFLFFGVFFAILLFSCKNDASDEPHLREPEYVIIVKGERIGAPNNIRVSGQNNSFSSSLTITFWPSSEAVEHFFYVSYSASKSIKQTLLASSGNPGSSEITYTIPKSSLSSAFTGQIISSPCYIGVASRSHAGVYSDIAWSENLYPGGSTYDPSGLWEIPNFISAGVPATLTITANYWVISNGDSGTLTTNGNNLTFSNMGVQYGTAVLSTSTTMTLTVSGTNYSATKLSS